MELVLNEEDTTSASPASPSSSDAGVRVVTTTSSSSFKRRAVSAPASPPPKRKSRKSTHTLRKEEKQLLLREMAQLQLQMEKLKRRALGGDSESRLLPQTAAQKSFAADVLQGALQQQLAQFVDAQMLFSAIGVVSPIALPVRLGAVRHERIAALAAMKDTRLRTSREFLARRCGALDPRKPFAEDQRFEAPNGDYCVVRCSNLQLEGAESVRQVYDTLQYYYRHIEISITEKLGHVTIREDDDVQGEDVYQNRLVGTAGNNLLVETNTVLFSEFVERDERGGACGLIASDFVDDDELYPYRPEERVRKDTSLILQLTSFMDKSPSASAGGRDAEKLVVVLTRWSYTRLHRPEFPVSNAAIRDVRENMAKWCETMMQSLRDSLVAGK